MKRHAKDHAKFLRRQAEGVVDSAMRYDIASQYRDAADEMERLHATAVAFNRLMSMMGQVYGEAGFPSAPTFVREALNYASRLSCGIEEWQHPSGHLGNTEEEDEIVSGAVRRMFEAQETVEAWHARLNRPIRVDAAGLCIPGEED